MNASLELLHEEKAFYAKFYERLDTLARDPDLLETLGTFGVEAFRRSCVLEGFEQFLHDHNVEGDTALEIGTYNGLTALVLARHFRRVITVDVAQAPLLDAISAHHGVENIVYVTVADNAEKARYITGLDFDFAFVDGDHEHDTVADFALVKRCGAVMFHEHWAAQPAVPALLASLTEGRTRVQGKFAVWTRQQRAAA